jgi:hypothetical protein
MKQSRAFCLIRQQPQYRHEAFEEGLAAAGYRVFHGQPLWPAAPGDVLCIWNRYDVTEQLADRFEAEGGTVIVAENGYIAPGGGTPKHDVRAGVTGKTMFALAKGRHNGGGEWHVGGPERWQQLGVELKDWRKTGDHILIAPNRSFGTRGNVMPNTWADETAHRLRRVTQRPVRVRHHPGNNRSPISLEKDLENCWAVVIWSSSVGVHALIAGIPVVCLANWWICKEAALRDFEQMNRGGVIDRRAAFERLAWAQWSLEEIESGQPFRILCGTSTAPATSTARP